MKDACRDAIGVQNKTEEKTCSWKWEERGAGGSWLHEMNDSWQLFVGAIPAPYRAVIAHTDQNVSVPWERCLANRWCTLWMRQRCGSYQCGIWCVNIPKEYFAALITECHVLAVIVESETNKPNFALFVLKAMENRCRWIAMLKLVRSVIQAARFPADDRIFAGLNGNMMKSLK